MSCGAKIWAIQTSSSLLSAKLGCFNEKATFTNQVFSAFEPFGIVITWIKLGATFQPQHTAKTKGATGWTHILYLIHSHQMHSSVEPWYVLYLIFFRCDQQNIYICIYLSVYLFEGVPGSWV